MISISDDILSLERALATLPCAMVSEQGLGALLCLARSNLQSLAEQVRKLEDAVDPCLCLHSRSGGGYGSGSGPASGCAPGSANLAWPEVSCERLQ